MTWDVHVRHISHGILSAGCLWWWPMSEEPQLIEWPRRETGASRCLPGVLGRERKRVWEATGKRSMMDAAG